MDPHMQQVLGECNDPLKLMKYMQDDDMRAKIERLARAGLVQIQ